MSRNKIKALLTCALAVMIAFMFPLTVWAECNHPNMQHDSYTGSYNKITDQYHTYVIYSHDWCPNCSYSYTHSHTFSEGHSISGGTISFEGHRNGRDYYHRNGTCSLCNESGYSAFDVPCNGGSSCGGLAINSVPDLEG